MDAPESAQKDKTIAAVGETSNTDPEILETACCALESLHPDLEGCIAALEERRTEEPAVSDQVTVFGALANETRLRTLLALEEGELCVCELQVVLEAPQSTVATHLRTLREAGLVTSRKRGKWTYYRIADTAVTELRNLADSIAVPVDE